MTSLPAPYNSPPRLPRAPRMRPGIDATKPTTLFNVKVTAPHRREAAPTTALTTVFQVVNVQATTAPQAPVTVVTISPAILVTQAVISAHACTPNPRMPQTAKPMVAPRRTHHEDTA